jgi:hypothetical protein
MEPDWDGLAETLHEIIAAAVPLLRADGVGLMLADGQGTLRWVTATNQAEQAFEQPSETWARARAATPTPGAR